MSVVHRSGSLPAPPYTGKGKEGSRVGLAVASMARHMTDEGFQLFRGLGSAGYRIYGKGLGDHWTNDVPTVLLRDDPSILILQDKREWEGGTAGRGFDDEERYRDVQCLKARADVFKVTVLKDAQNRPEYHKASADEIGAHAWIVYYKPERVAGIAPYVRLKHLIRTYHTMDRYVVPYFSPEGRTGCLLSGAVGPAYPLRTRLVRDHRQLPETTVLRHPGYHRNGSCTPDFLKLLSRYKVAICTASRYGYALRKIVEATACGCRVVTDLPVDDVLPHIDGNLVRVHSSTSTHEIGKIVKKLIDQYNPSVQHKYANLACDYYDYRYEGVRLTAAIQRMREAYA